MFKIASMKIIGTVIFLAIAVCFLSCGNKPTLFTKITPGHSNIDFENTIKEDDSINPLDLTNLYNGGGVGVGDFNNDGLQDLYFTGNRVSNKLYLNKGGFVFDDVTDKANVGGDGKWSRGVAVVDINNDGWMDIYVCATIYSKPERRRNMLFINKGVDKDGVPHFEDMAKEYGLADTVYSTMAEFFDYDNDGDLDMYLTVNQIVQKNSPSVFRPIIKDGSFPSTGRLYKNDWNPTLKHGVFSNVSKEAGITVEGFGHSATIADINNDGWKDIYVSNDFIGDDLLYINNKNGTFTDRAAEYFKHTSANGMGQDIQDINNDGLADVVEVDMDPQDNFRKKMMLNAIGYQTYQNSDLYGYQYQYVRNSLQINQGPRVNAKDSVGAPVFSEVSFLGGIAETDWSWTPLVADFDNDAYRDIIITNGYPKDVTDHDFIAFRREASDLAPKKYILEQIPEVKIKNYAFRNNGGIHFSNATVDWGLDEPSFSNGAAYVDLDNDGDLDVVVNNINSKAMLYKNNAIETKKASAHYLQVNFASEPPNVNGLGARVELHYGKGKQQVCENTPYRGYLSTDQQGAHFGLGLDSTVDTVLVKWPDGNMQLLTNVKANQVLTLKHADAHAAYTWALPVIATGTLLREISDSLKANIVHKEDDNIDFNIQKLLPHKLSDYSPGLAVGDINGDGLDDMVMSGSYSYSAKLLTQQQNGQFATRDLLPGANHVNKMYDDRGVLLLDADGDGDLDMYIATGGYRNLANSEGYMDRLYVNDGKGNFRYDSAALPANYASKSCARAVDIDNDGDLDIFVAGRCVPGKYPMPVSCAVYRNDSKNGKVTFTDVTASVAPGLKDVGMVCDAVWTDFNNDGWVDLILAGEFMPIKFFKNNHGRLEPMPTGLDNQLGWWNSIVPGDFDNDGDIDYVVGNTGQNSFYRPTEQYPVRVYAKDFDKNGVFDALPSLYLPTSGEDSTMREYPAQLREQEISQMIEFRRKFPTYRAYAHATMDSLLTPDELKGALVLKANNFKSAYLRNDGNGQFTMVPLPVEAQFSALFGMVAEDIDGDGNLDVVINGNDYGTEVSVGRYDALNGLVLKGDGKGGFKPLSILQSGLFIPGNGKALVKFYNKQGNCLLAASQNRGPLKVFQIKQAVTPVRANKDDVFAMLTLKSGRKRKVELNYGAGFLSQSARVINADAQVTSIEITNSKGEKRMVKF